MPAAMAAKSLKKKVVMADSGVACGRGGGRAAVRAHGRHQPPERLVVVAALAARPRPKPASTAAEEGTPLT
jgi:hypothetical protein